MNDDVKDNGSEFGIDDDHDDNDDHTYMTSQMTQQNTAQNVQPNQRKSATNNGERCIVVDKTPRIKNKNSSVKIGSTRRKLSLLGSENQSDVSSKKGKKILQSRK